MKKRTILHAATCSFVLGAFGICVAFGNESTAPVAQESCVTCHTCDTPSVEAPCLQPCPTKGERASTFPAFKGEVPEVVILDILSNHYEGVKFNHAGHASMSVIGKGCVTCHHYGPEDKILSCSACHGITPDVEHLNQPGLRGAYHRQCLGCHRDWSHENACNNCHVPVGSPQKPSIQDPTDIVGAAHPPITTVPTYAYETPEAEDTVVTFHHVDHAQVFGLQCASCHVEESCRNCHDVGGATTTQRLRDDPHQDCVKCHLQQTEDDCTFCHTEDARPRFDHTVRSGFDLTRWHAEKSCTSCHEAPTVFAGLDPACVSCHATDWQPEGFDHAATGFVFDEEHQEIECMGCHDEGLGLRPRCDACHDEMYGPDPASAQRTAEGEPKDE